MVSPLSVSSKTAVHNLEVTAVLDSMLGLELISMSQGFKSSVSIKSAPYNSKEAWEK